MDATLSPAHPPAGMPARRWLRRLAWLCAAMVLAITSLSAFVRLVNTGVGCEPWPACYGQLQLARAQSPAATPLTQAGASDTAIAVARTAHRIIASSSLVVVLALLALALRQRWRPETALAGGLLTLALFLAVLGAATRSSLLPAVTLGNLLAGFAMLVLAVRLARRSAPGATASPLARWVWVALALCFVQMALGGLVSSGHAGLSCPALGSCDISSGTWRTLNPWFVPVAGTAPDHAGGAIAHLLHRAAGLALSGFLAIMAWRAWRMQRKAAALALVALPLLQVGLGLGIIAQQLPLAGTWAHNLVAALLVALVAALGTSTQQRPR